MAKSFQQKLKILYLLRAFVEETDEKHPMKVTDLQAYLDRFDISVERKTIYDDIETLRIFGMDIVNRREQPSGYYLASRKFELPELKLLVDVVQSSRFITSKKSRQLIAKLESLTSIYEAKQLRRQTFSAQGIKTINESIYYNVDTIHNALMNNRQITFQYYEWTIHKSMRLKKNGERYRVSPWGLIWKEENYYLIALDENSGIVKHYRVDKILKINIEKQERNGKEFFANFDAGQFAARTFGMFGGREESICLEFENHLAGVAIDHFGQDIMIHQKDAGHFTTFVRVNISNQFFGWLAALGPGVVIRSPEHLRKEYTDFLKKSLKKYDTVL